MPCGYKMKDQRAGWESRVCLVTLFMCDDLLSLVTCHLLFLCVMTFCHFVKPAKDLPLQLGKTSLFAGARGVFYPWLRHFLDIGHLAFLLEHENLKLAG